MSEKLLKSRGALCNIVRRIAIAAGDITLDYFELGHDMDVQEKGDGSPVTLADQKAEEYIEQALLEIIPDVPMIGEESVAAGRVTDLSRQDYFWLVDPLDGTREFIAGRKEFTVNIALIYKGDPVMGVVYAPALGELYGGYHDLYLDQYKAFKWSDEADKDKDIHVRSGLANGLTIVSSKSHGDNGRQDKFLEQFKVAKIVKRGSSLKICAIAAGKADMYPRFGPTCEWDTAAGHAVLRGAGGFLRKIDGSKLVYGQSDDPKLLNPEFIASSFEWWEAAQE